jgi:hypothetical protein
MSSVTSRTPAVRKIPARYFDEWESMARNNQSQFMGIFVQKLRYTSGQLITAILQDGSCSQENLLVVCDFVKTLPDHGIIVICERS